MRIGTDETAPHSTKLHAPSIRFFQTPKAVERPRLPTGRLRGKRGVRAPLLCCHAQSFGTCTCSLSYYIIFPLCRWKHAPSAPVMHWRIEPEDDQARSFGATNLRDTAFKATTIDERDIRSAAISGRSERPNDV